jgi:hypothetical protein
MGSIYRDKKVVGDCVFRAPLQHNTLVVIVKLLTENQNQKNQKK